MIEIRRTVSGKTKAALAAELESAQQRIAELENALARQQASTFAFEETLRWAQTRYRLLFEQAPTIDVIMLLIDEVAQV